MMSISQIKNYEFAPQRGGTYKSSEVDSVFSEVNATIDALVGAYEKAKKENEELYKKMNVLADKIEEYKKDEDSVRTLLLTAQKMADSLVKEAKESAREIVDGANAEAENAISLIKEKTDNYVIENKNKADEYLRNSKLEYDRKMAEVEDKAQGIIDRAKAEADKIINDAESKSQEIIAKTNLQADEISQNTSATIEHAKTKLATLKSLTASFKENVVDILNKQLALFESMSVEDGEYSAEYYPRTYHVDAEAVYHPEFTSGEHTEDEDSDTGVETEVEAEAVDSEIVSDEDAEAVYETVSDEPDFEEISDTYDEESEDQTDVLEETEEFSFEEAQEDEYYELPEDNSSEEGQDSETVDEEEIEVEEEEIPVGDSDYFDELMRNLAENPVEDRSILGERQSEVKSVVKPQKETKDNRNIFTKIDLEEGLDDEDDDGYDAPFDEESAEQLKFGKDFDIFDDDDEASQGSFFSKFKKK